MNTQLPSYLRASYHAAPRPEQTVTCGEMRITVISPCVMRIEKGAFTDAPTLTVVRRDLGYCPFEKRVTDNTLTVETSMLRLTARIGQPISPETLQIERKAHPYFVWRYGEKPSFNLGGTVSTLDRVNGEIPLEDGMCSLDGFTVLDDSGVPAITPEGWFAPRQTAVDMYFFGHGHDYTLCVQEYTRLTGAAKMLPAFVLGNWWSRYYKYTQEEYLTLMDRFRREDVPLSVAIVDMDWHLTDGDGRNYHKDGWTGYTWNRDFFPNPAAFLAALHEKGLRTALNLHPAQGVRPWDDQYEDMAKARGIDPSTKEPVPCEYLDPAFYGPYFELLHFPQEEQGVDFWWMDWQQGSDYRRIVGEGRYKPNALENSITPLWLMNHMHYLASMRNGGRGLMFSRFAGYGSQRYPIGFSGDTVISWESLDFQPYFTLTASNIGYGWWSHDIGGHWGGVRDDELNTRWIQLGVFSPIFRLHSTQHPFLGREPWAYGRRAETVIGDFMRLRHRLFPYLYTMAHRDCEEQIPLVRPMYHLHPEQAGAYKVRNEYWFGSEMVVSPITAKTEPKGAMAAASVWLPEGVWTDAFTGYIYHGGTFRAYRPLETMPVFLKAGAIIPMQAHTPHGNTLGGSESLEVLIAPGADGSFTLYEDDGESLDYENGRFCLTPMTTEWHDREARFTVAPVQGDGSLIPARRDYTLTLRGFRKGASFRRADGTEIEAQWQAENCTYTIKVEGVAATEGFTLLLSNEKGLIHDNSDIEARLERMLIAAQCALDVKDSVMRQERELLRRVSTDQLAATCEFGAGMDTCLPQAVMELHHQYQRALGAPERY